MLKVSIAPAELVAILLCLSILLLFSQRLLRYLNDALSFIAHNVLCMKNPVRHMETGIMIPTARYRWPNGQGDVAKFLQGKENGSLWRESFGRIYRIWSGTTQEIVLTTPEQVQTIFRDSDRHFKATNNNSGYLFSQILGSCVGMISQDDWKRVRAIVEPAFSRDASKRYVSLIVGRTSQYMQELRTLPLISNGYIDPARDLKMLPFWVIAEIIYGQLSPKMEAELKSIARVREELYKYVIAGGLVRFAWSKYLPIAANKLLRSFRSQWLSFNERARVAAEERGAGHLPICSIYKAIEGKICTIPEILHTLDEILFANLDVTTGGLTWNLVQLAAHPDVQAVLRAEIAKVNSNAIGKEAAFEAYLSDPSTYLQCIILESSRLRPLIAFSIPQAAPSTRILDGYTFPAGTNFTVDSYSLNQRDRYWGADGLQFRPERFLDWKATEARYTFWRFGYGPRQCLGKYVADVIIRCVLVQISESYDLELDKEGLEWGRHEEVWIDHPNLKLRCRKRS